MTVSVTCADGEDLVFGEGLVDERIRPLSCDGSEAGFGDGEVVRAGSDVEEVVVPAGVGGGVAGDTGVLIGEGDGGAWDDFAGGSVMVPLTVAEAFWAERWSDEHANNAPKRYGRIIREERMDFLLYDLNWILIEARSTGVSRIAAKKLVEYVYRCQG